MKKYTISIHGYGCEVTIGSVSEELKQILSNPEKELIDMVTGEELEDYGGWYGIDDQYHRWGASGGFRIEVWDESNNTIFETTSESIHEHEGLVEYDTPDVDESLDLLMCVGFEKGGFFEGRIETEGDFDLSKLKIKIDEDVEMPGHYHGEIVAGVEYDGEEVDNYGGSTDGKSFDVYATFRDE